MSEFQRIANSDRGSVFALNALAADLAAGLGDFGVDVVTIDLKQIETMAEAAFVEILVAALHADQVVIFDGVEPTTDSYKLACYNIDHTLLGQGGRAIMVTR